MKPPPRSSLLNVSDGLAGSACLYSAVTVLDWAIVAFTVAFALWGYRQGLIVGVLTLFGFAAGALAGSRGGPLLLSEGSSSPLSLIHI